MDSLNFVIQLMNLSTVNVNDCYALRDDKYMNSETNHVFILHWLLSVKVSSDLYHVLVTFIALIAD